MHFPLQNMSVVVFSLQRKMSDTSSSPNLLEKDDDDDDSSAEVDEEEEEDDDPSAEVDEEDGDDEDPFAMVDEDDKSSDEVEAIVQKKGRSRFQWSHTTCIVDNGNSKDEALICILLAKEPWNAGHGREMKAWQNLLAIVLETVVDGDKIFQGVSEATLKKGISCILTLARKRRWKKRNEKTNQRMKMINMI